ncbi:bacteriorhodopsin [Lewinella sp. W8]|uniref:bacteriorhodopsin n=1 Tax=Lewinella sp. W8 TaxID=2528208 RepID=UPI001068142A|nr:bacteriorhodopsin [Lewinella sp. W8]MTB51407.1 rhodopsin [Lewinella sp. W8]
MTPQLGNANFENYIGATDGYSEMAYQMVAHLLTLGYAVMFAALIYFILTLRYVAPRFRMSNILSVVVMVSAGLLLYSQSENWKSSFVYDADAGVYLLNAGGDLFNNGYRYLNWLIDVPMLLFQMLFVITLTKSSFSSVRNQFWFSGVGMIVTGYIGQYYEVSNLTAFFVWGAISTVFFFHVLYLMNKIIKEGKEGLEESGKKVLSTIWIIFLISWFLYPGAYLMPYLGGLGEDGLLFNESGVVGRQMTYTAADIISKVIYGVLLGVLAQKISTKEGYDYTKQLG